MPSRPTRRRSQRSSAASSDPSGNAFSSGGIAFAFFGARMVVMVSRQVFAMARDRRFPAGRLMSRVNPRTRTPIATTVLIVVIGIVLMVVLSGDALNPAARRRNDTACPDVRRDRRALPRGAQEARAQGGRLQSRPLRASGDDRRARLGRPCPGRPHHAAGLSHPLARGPGTDSHRWCLLCLADDLPALGARE